MVNIHADTIPRYFTIERLNAGRLRDLVILHHAVYGRKPELDIFARKYDTSFAGVSFIGYIAYNQDKFPVAYYGVFPLWMEQQGKIFLAAQSGDTMTHPAYRNKGLFVYLANRTYDLCRQYDIKLVYGFPNQDSEHGLINKLGWKTGERLLRYHITVRPVVFGKIIRRLTWWRRRVLSKYRVAEDGLQHSGAAEGFGGVHRSEAYLAYKKYNSSCVLRILDAKLWLRIRDDLTIGDMDCTEAGFERVMEQLKDIALRLGLNQVNFQVSPGTRLNALFAAKYTPVESFPVCFKLIDETATTQNIKFTFSDIDIF